MWTDAILKLLKLDGLVNNLTAYVETRLEIIKLEVREEIARALARLSVLILVVASIALFILFLSVSVALWIGHYIGMVEGFAIVTAVYFVLALLALTLRASISEALERKLLQKLRDE
jgi:uncharacterized membrane protein YqjE